MPTFKRILLPGSATASYASEQTDKRTYSSHYFTPTADSIRDSIRMQTADSQVPTVRPQSPPKRHLDAVSHFATLHFPNRPTEKQTDRPTK